MEKKPFHEVIINEMRKAAESVGVSAGAEDLLKRFGNIFRKAILPRGKKLEIAEAIRDLAKNFPNASRDTVPAQHYLQVLADDVEK